MYLKYQENICYFSFDLEETTKIEPQLCGISIEIPEFDLLHFYGDLDYQNAFKELFHPSIFA